MQVNVVGDDYSSTAVQFHTERASDPLFNFISAAAAKNTVFSVRGDGFIHMTQLSIPSGGLMIQTGGVTIADFGLKAFSSSTVDPVVYIRSTANYGRAAPVLLLSSVTPSTAANYLMRAQNQGHTRFTIRADGRTQIHTGGLLVTAGVSILSNGLSVIGGETIENMGLVVLTGGATLLSGGINIVADGATIVSGGLLVNNGTFRFNYYRERRSCGLVYTLHYFLSLQ